MKNIQKALRFMKKNGISNMVPIALERLIQQRKSTYEFHVSSESILEQQRNTVFTSRKCISIVVPAYETHPVYLKMLIESVIRQTYPVWELIIADASSTSQVLDVIQNYKDDRIRYVKLEQNLGISGNTNQAILLAEGEYTGLLDHDDVLTPDALFEVMKCIDQHEAVLVYSDEDKTDETGKAFYEPHNKSDFNLDLFLSNNYICHFTVIKTDLLKELKFRPMFDGAQDYDLFLRIVAKIMDDAMNAGNNAMQELKNQIYHIPKILYHWRCHSGSTAENPDSKQYAYDAGKKAIQYFLTARNWKGTVEHTQHLGFYKINYVGLFQQRTEIGLVGGNGYHHGRVRYGAMDANGNLLFDRLPRRFSGKMHRAVLQQQVDALDIRNMISCPDVCVKELVDQAQKKLKNMTKYPDEMQIRQISLTLCRQIQDMGYVILYDPAYHTGR